MTDRYTSPLGDRRERPVDCRCGRPTWALDRTCDSCHAADCRCGVDGDAVPLCSGQATAGSFA